MFTSRFNAIIGYEFPIFFFILLGVIKFLILETSGLFLFGKSSVKRHLWTMHEAQYMK